MRLSTVVMLLVAGMGVFAAAGDGFAKPDTVFDAGVTYLAPAENDDGDVDTEVQRTLAWLKGMYGFPAGERLHLIFGLEYTGQFVDYDDFAAVPGPAGLIRESDLPEELHALDFIAGLVWSVSDDWRAIFQFRPGIHSDFEDVSSDDWVYAGMALAVRGFGDNPRNRVGVGAYLGDALGRIQALPLVRLYWYPSEKWFLEGTLPLELDAGYRASKALSFGLEAALRGYQYRLTEDAPWDDAVLRYSEVRAGLFADYGFWKNLHVRLSGGAALAQTFELRDDDNDRKLADGDYENTGYLSVNLYYAL